MKKYFSLLIMTFGILIIGNGQNQELNTIIETLVRLNNLDSYYEQQVVYYQNYYEGLQIQVEEVIDEGKLIQKRIEGKQRIKRKNQIILDEVNKQLVFLREDLSFIKEFINLWKIYENFDGKKRKDFQNNYDADKCYLIKSEYEEFEPYEYEIKYEEVYKDIVWEERVEGIENYKKGERIEIKPAGTKWVKQKADRNCLSNDPEDCYVWCLIKS